MTNKDCLTIMKKEMEESLQTLLERGSRVDKKAASYLIAAIAEMEEGGELWAIANDNRK